MQIPFHIPCKFFLLYDSLQSTCDTLNIVCHTHVFICSYIASKNTIYAEYVLHKICAILFKLIQKMFKNPLLRQFVYSGCMYIRMCSKYSLNFIQVRLTEVLFAMSTQKMSVTNVTNVIWAESCFCVYCICIRACVSKIEKKEKGKRKRNENGSYSVRARIDKALVSSIQIKSHFISFPNYFNGQNVTKFDIYMNILSWNLLKAWHMRLCTMYFYKIA